MSNDLLRTAPAVRDFSPLTMPQPRIIECENGVTLHLIDAPGQGIASITLAWEAAAAEAAHQGLPTGAPGLAAELLREGSTNFSGAQIADAVDFEGATLAARAGEHYTLVELTALTKSLPTLLPIVTDMVTNPEFPAGAFEAIRTKQAQKADIDLAKPALLTDRRFTSMMAGIAHPYANIMTGNELRAISRDDVVACHSIGFAGGKMHIFYCGQVDDEMVDRLSVFAHTLRAVNQPITSGYYVPFAPEAPGLQVVSHSDPNQIAISMGLPTIKREDPHYIPLRTAIMALGGHFGSRLNSNIRERLGLTYGISAGLYGQAEGAYLNVQAQCRRGTADRVIAEIKNEIVRLANEPLDGDEFAALHSIVASALAANVDSPLAVMRHHVSALLSAMPANYYANQWQSWLDLTPEVVAEMARLYLSVDNLRIAVTD